MEKCNKLSVHDISDSDSLELFEGGGRREREEVHIAGIATFSHLLSQFYTLSRRIETRQDMVVQRIWPIFRCFALFIAVSLLLLFRIARAQGENKRPENRSRRVLLIRNKWNGLTQWIRDDSLTCAKKKYSFISSTEFWKTTVTTLISLFTPVNKQKKKNENEPQLVSDERVGALPVQTHLQISILDYFQ